MHHTANGMVHFLSKNTSSLKCKKMVLILTNSIYNILCTLKWKFC